MAPRRRATSSRRGACTRRSGCLSDSFRATTISARARTHRPTPLLLPITEARRQRYLAHFGEDYWSLDVPGWRLLALDAQLLGSDLDSAGAQLDFLRQSAASGGRSIAMFVHKPLFHTSPEEAVVTGRFINPVPRKQLLDSLKNRPPALVASGHVHQFLSNRLAQVHHVWAPSTGFVLPDSRQPRYGLKQTGYVMHDLMPDGRHESRLVQVPGLETLDIANFPEAYGPLHRGPRAGQVEEARQGAAA